MNPLKMIIICRLSSKLLETFPNLHAALAAPLFISRIGRFSEIDSNVSELVCSSLKAKFMNIELISQFVWSVKLIRQEFMLCAERKMIAPLT